MVIPKPYQMTTNLTDDYYLQVQFIVNRARKRDIWYRIGYAIVIIIISIITYQVVKGIIPTGNKYAAFCSAILPAVVFITCAGYFLDDIRSKDLDTTWTEFKLLTLPYVEHIILTDAEKDDWSIEEWKGRRDLYHLERYAQDLGIAKDYKHLKLPDDLHEKEPSPWISSLKLIIVIPVALFGCFIGGAFMGSGGGSYGSGVGKESTTLSYGERNRIRQFLNITKHHK